jgi:hypothetical protein
MMMKWTLVLLEVKEVLTVRRKKMMMKRSIIESFKNEKEVFSLLVILDYPLSSL